MRHNKTEWNHQYMFEMCTAGGQVLIRVCTTAALCHQNSLPQTITFISSRCLRIFHTVRRHSASVFRVGIQDVCCLPPQRRKIRKVGLDCTVCWSGKGKNGQEDEGTVDVTRSSAKCRRFDLADCGGHRQADENRRTTTSIIRDREAQIWRKWQNGRKEVI